MSDDFDDLPSGSGESPTKEQVLAVYNYLRARGRDTGTGSVLEEVKALGFTTSRASIGRKLDGAPGRAEPPKCTPAKKPEAERAKKPPQKLDTPEKRTQRKWLNNKHEHKIASPSEAAVKSIGEVASKLIEQLADDTFAADMKELMSKEGGGPKHSSTDLAIEQSRVWMAAGIALGRRMVDRIDIAMLDLRGAAALYDALTCGVKVSGGAAIDISKPSAAQPQANGVSPGGFAMKELNPGPNLASDLSQFRRERAAERAQRT